MKFTVDCGSTTAFVSSQTVIKEPDLVVAIDVGSTYSGYAWQYRSDFLNNRSNIEFNLNWGEGAPQVRIVKAI